MNQYHQRLGAVAAVVLIAAGAFVVGRFTAPLRVETRDVERVVYKDRTVEKRVEVMVAAKAEVRVVYREKVVTRDGTTTVREVERSDTKHHATTTAAATRIVDREVEKVREAEKVVTLRPDWRVAVHAGASLQAPAVPLAGPLVLGAAVDRRLVGGLSAGVWLNTSGAAGASLSFEF